MNTFPKYYSPMIKIVSSVVIAFSLISCGESESKKDKELKPSPLDYPEPSKVISIDDLNNHYFVTGILLNHIDIYQTNSAKNGLTRIRNDSKINPIQCFGGVGNIEITGIDIELTEGNSEIIYSYDECVPHSANSKYRYSFLSYERVLWSSNQIIEYHQDNKHYFSGSYVPIDRAVNISTYFNSNTSKLEGSMFVVEYGNSYRINIIDSIEIKLETKPVEFVKGSFNIIGANDSEVFVNINNSAVTASLNGGTPIEVDMRHVPPIP